MCVVDGGWSGGWVGVVGGGWWEVGGGGSRWGSKSEGRGRSGIGRHRRVEKGHRERWWWGVGGGWWWVVVVVGGGWWVVVGGGGGGWWGVGIENLSKGGKRGTFSVGNSQERGL